MSKPFNFATGNRFFGEPIRHGFDGLAAPVEIRMRVVQCHVHVAVAHLCLPIR